MRRRVSKRVSIFVMKQRLLVLLVVILISNIVSITLIINVGEAVDSMPYHNIYKRRSLHYELQNQEAELNKTINDISFSACPVAKKSPSYSKTCESEMKSDELVGNKTLVEIRWSLGRSQLLENNKCSFLKHIKFIYQADICDSNVSLIILISSSPSNSEKRWAIRRTWGNTSSRDFDSQTRQEEAQYIRSVRIVFLLGVSAIQTSQNNVESENLAFGDIVQGDFIDAYRNLTYKTIMGMTWTGKKCQQAKFVMKTDDDTFVNINNLLLFLHENGRMLDQGLAGSCFGCTKPDRENGSKSYISYGDYPETFYPGFCSGVGYLTSMRIVQRLVIYFKRFPVLPLEDIYISLCIYNLNLKLFNVAGFITVKPPSIPCLFKQDQLIVAHGLSPRLLNYIWTTPCDLRLNVNKDHLEEWRKGLVT